VPHLLSATREQGLRIMQPGAVEKAEADMVLEYLDVENPVEAGIGRAVTQRIVMDDFMRVRSNIAGHAAQGSDDFPVIGRQPRQPVRDLSRGMPEGRIHASDSSIARRRGLAFRGTL
jgi:hypothetical protein